MLYEFTYLIRPDVAESQVETILEKYKAVIKANGGDVAKVEQWGLRSLAYKINNNKKAFYTFLHINAPSAAVDEMERQMRIDEDILRFLAVRVETFEEGASAVVRRIEKEEKKRRELEQSSDAA